MKLDLGILVLALLFAVVFSSRLPTKPALPIVFWHGMGDTCCSMTAGIGSLKHDLEETYGAFVFSVQIGGNSLSDFTAGYVGSVDEQVKEVCEAIRRMPELQNGYNAVGFSQGGQFLRAVAERCNDEGPKMKTLISMGGQHQGVMAYPGCDVIHDTSFICKQTESVIELGVYLPGVRSSVVQAQYFKDPFQYDRYLRSNQFLKDINNDGEDKNNLYRQNLISLEKFVMVKFEFDVTVIPKESSWFGYFDGKEMLTLQQQETYIEDWIGLRTMDEQGKLVFLECPTEHMSFSNEWFAENIWTPFLS